MKNPEQQLTKAQAVLAERQQAVGDLQREQTDVQERVRRLGRDGGNSREIEKAGSRLAALPHLIEAATDNVADAGAAVTEAERAVSAAQAAELQEELKGLHGTGLEVLALQARARKLDRDTSLWLTQLSLQRDQIVREMQRLDPDAQVDDWCLSVSHTPYRDSGFGRTPSFELVMERIDEMRNGHKSKTGKKLAGLPVPDLTVEIKRLSRDLPERERAAAVTAQELLEQALAEEGAVS